MDDQLRQLERKIEDSETRRRFITELNRAGKTSAEYVKERLLKLESEALDLLLTEALEAGEWPKSSLTERGAIVQKPAYFVSLEHFNDRDDPENALLLCPDGLFYLRVEYLDGHLGKYPSTQLKMPAETIPNYENTLRAIKEKRAFTEYTYRAAIREHRRR